MKEYLAPTRIDLAGGWTDIPYLIKGRCGFVSDVAIKPLVAFKSELYMNGYPRGTGLATSTAVKAVEAIKENKLNGFKEGNLREIAEELFRLENDDLNWAIGRQDPYAVVYGGFNCFRFGQTEAQLEKFDISNEALNKLESNLFLFYSGISRNAQVIVEEVYTRFNSGDSLARRALVEIGECGREFAIKLQSGELSECAKTMSKNWEYQKILAPSSSNLSIDRIYEFAINEGALGGKVCGAGGGGALVFYTKDKESLGRKLENKFPEGRVIPFSFEMRNIVEINSEKFISGS